MTLPSRILALDLATRLGWALWSPGTPLEYGSHLLPRTGPHAGTFLDAYRTWLMPQLARLDLVVYEQPILPQRTRIETLRKLYSLAGFTELVCIDLKIRCREIPMQKWRKHFMGRGGGFKHIGTDAKTMAIDEARARGFTIQGDDEADAIGIMDYTAAKLEIPTDWPDRGLLGLVA